MEKMSFESGMKQGRSDHVLRLQAPKQSRARLKQLTT